MLVEKMVEQAFGELHTLTELKGLSSFASDPVLLQLNGASISIPYSAMIRLIVSELLLKGFVRSLLPFLFSQTFLRNSFHFC
jgi:hypothetical protein